MTSPFSFHSSFLTLACHVNCGRPLLWSHGGDVMQEFAKEFYSSRAWQECRKAYKKSVGGLCERCLKTGRLTPGEIVHHKIHLTPQNINNAAVCLSWANLECVCRDCHADLHSKKNKRFVIDAQGRIEIIQEET